jgi:hypothetical protein
VNSIAAVVAERHRYLLDAVRTAMLTFAAFFLWFAGRLGSFSCCAQAADSKRDHLDVGINEAGANRSIRAALSEQFASKPDPWH